MQSGPTWEHNERSLLPGIIALVQSLQGDVVCLTIVVLMQRLWVREVKVVRRLHIIHQAIV